MPVLDASWTQRLDAAGEFTARVPLADPRAVEAQTGRTWLQYREHQGFVFAGLIERPVRRPPAAIELRGLSLLGELLHDNTLLNRQYDEQTINTIIDDLLSATAWTRTGSLTDVISIRFDGESVLQASLLAVEQAGKHLREKVTEQDGALTRELEIGAFGGSSGVTIMNGLPHAEVLSDAKLAGIVEGGFSVEECSDDLWNWVLPLGAGDGTAQLTLQYATRTSPYTIDTVTGPDGRDIYYIKDDTSITTYGQRQRPFVAKDIAPLSNTKAALQAAANALYDLAAAQLDRWKSQQNAYTLTVVGLSPAVRPGDKVRVRYRGYARRWDEETAYLDVDEELYVLERTTQFAQDGSQRDDLLVSDIDRVAQNDDNILIGKLEQTARSFRSHIQVSLSQHDTGPFIEELDASHPAQARLSIRDNVVQLLRCTVVFRGRAIRSPVDTADQDAGSVPTSSAGGAQTSSSGGATTTSAGGAQTSSSGGGQTTSSGGGPTTGAGGGQTTSSGGGQTSSTAASHTHGVIGQTAEDDGASVPTTSVEESHRHGFVLGDEGASAPSVWRLLRGKNQSGGALSVVVGSFDSGSGLFLYSDTADGQHDHTVSVPSHEHDVSATTSSSGGSHSHTVSNHTHSVDNHTHTVSSHDHTVSNHTHTVSNHTHDIGNHTHDVNDHTHTVTVPAHSHDLVFGIFEGSSPANIQLWINSINRTSALGGPWSATGAEVDITQYFLDGDGHVVRGNHTVEFRVPSGLGRIEAHVHWDTVIAPIPV